LTLFRMFLTSSNNGNIQGPNGSEDHTR